MECKNCKREKPADELIWSVRGIACCCKECADEDMRIKLNEE